MPLFVPDMRKDRPSRTWRRRWILLPRLGYLDGRSTRTMLWPGVYETRVSASLYRRLWRKIP